MKILNKIKFPALWCACFAICLLVYLGLCTFSYSVDKKLPEEHFRAEDLQLVALVDKYADGTYIATDADPRIIIAGGRRVKKVTLKAQYYVAAGEAVCFYKASDDAEYSMKNCVLAREIDGGFEFDFKSKAVSEVRIDPTSVAGNRIAINDIAINENLVLMDYLDLSAFTVFLLIAYSCILCCIAKYLMDCFNNH